MTLQSNVYGQGSVPPGIEIDPPHHPRRPISTQWGPSEPRGPFRKGAAVGAPHSARSIRAVGVRAAIRAGTAATTLASTRAPSATRITGTTGTVGSGTA